LSGDKGVKRKRASKKRPGEGVAQALANLYQWAQVLSFQPTSDQLDQAIEILSKSPKGNRDKDG
jgi:hypothetical protein